jgi:hypothetical protein
VWIPIAGSSAWCSWQSGAKAPSWSPRRVVVVLPRARKTKQVMGCFLWIQMWTGEFKCRVQLTYNYSNGSKNDPKRFWKFAANTLKTYGL